MLSFLPTDNLYKTCTILAAALLLTIFTGLYNYEDRSKAEQLEYQKQYALLEAGGATKPALDRYSEMANAKIEQEEGNRDVVFFSAIMVGIVAMIMFGFGLAGWKEEQDRQDKIADKEIT